MQIGEQKSISPISNMTQSLLARSTPAEKSRGGLPFKNEGCARRTP